MHKKPLEAANKVTPKELTCFSPPLDLCDLTARCAFPALSGLFTEPPVPTAPDGWAGFESGPEAGRKCVWNKEKCWRRLSLCATECGSNLPSTVASMQACKAMRQCVAALGRLTKQFECTCAVHSRSCTHTVPQLIREPSGSFYLSLSRF